MVTERRAKWEQYGDIMQTCDLMEIMDCSKETALKMIHQPGFPKLRVSGGRKFIFVKTALQEYFHKQALGT